MEGKCMVLMILHCSFLSCFHSKHTLFCFELWSVIYHLLGISALHKPGGSASECTSVHARGGVFIVLCVCAFECVV